MEPFKFNTNINIFYITQFLHSLVFTIPIWIAYYQKILTVEQISILVTFAYLSQMVLELPSGALADMLGRKLTTTIAFVIGAIAFILFPFASTFWHFMVLAFLVGASDSFRSGSEEALIYDSLKESNQESKFAKVVSKAELFYQSGLICATAVGGLLFELNFAIPYLLYGFSLGIASIVSLFYTEPKLDSEKFGLKSYINQIKNGTKEAFKDVYTKYISLFYIFVAGISWSGTLYFDDYMLLGLGFNDSTRGLITAGLRIINAIFVFKILTNQKLFTKNRVIILFPIIMTVAFLPGILLDGLWGLPFVQLAMISTTTRWVLLSPITNGAFSSKNRATAISVLSLLIGVVYISLTSISGPIIANFGIKYMYSLLGIFTILTVIPLSYKVLKHIKI